MLLAVLSDTHLDSPDHWLERVYDRFLARADAVLHCGDMASASVYHFFLQHPNFHAVAGNMDSWNLRQEVPNRLSLDLDGLSVGMIHGFGGDRETMWKKAADCFGPECDLVCFGHTHIYQWVERDGQYVLNPGSARLPRAGAPSLALVRRAKDGSLSCECVDLRCF